MDSGITPLSPQQTATQEQQAGRENYILRALVAFDQLCNVVIFNGAPDETISSHSARAATEGKLWGKLMSHFLDIFQSDHGAKAEAGDLERATVVTGLEDNAGDLSK
jgi:hypothetical protein